MICWHWADIFLVVMVILHVSVCNVSAMMIFYRHRGAEYADS